MATAEKTVPQRDRIIKKLGKRPKTAAQLAEQLGFKSGQALSRVLSKLVAEGIAIVTVEKGVKGYAKAAA